MALIFGNPQLEQQLYADAYFRQSSLMPLEDQDLYDPFVKKWLKKRKEKRAKKPKVIKRRIKKDKKRVAKGKKPRHPELIKKAAPPPPKPPVRKTATPIRQEKIQVKGKEGPVTHGKSISEPDVLARQKQAGMGKAAIVLLLLGGGLILKKIIDHQKNARLLKQAGQL